MTLLVPAPRFAILSLVTLAALPVLPALAGAQAKPAAAKGASLRYAVAPTGNEARYRVREQLVGRDLPNDVIGVTKFVSGRIIVDQDGKVRQDSSKIVVLVDSLKSDQTRRDNYLRRRTLETTKYPNVEIVPTSIQGLLTPMAPGTTRTLTLTGNVTIHGVTRPTTWQVVARPDGSAVVGTATTAFTFKDFTLEQPKVPIVLSVADTVKLEYDFRFVPMP